MGRGGARASVRCPIDVYAGLRLEGSDLTEECAYQLAMLFHPIRGCLLSPLTAPHGELKRGGHESQPPTDVAIRLGDAGSALEHPVCAPSP